MGSQAGGFEFRISLLNEWIMKGLVDDGDRGDNVGKRPVYRYGCRHYRRVLQVLKLYSRGIKSADQILIMLFLNGRGVKPFEVREPIAREFARARPRSMLMARSPDSTRTGRFRQSTRRASSAALGALTSVLSKQESFLVLIK